jgi:hypothetical protein
MTIDDPRIAEFLELWHENGRSFFTKSYPKLDYDSDQYAKKAKDRGKKYIYLDEGGSGAFLLEKATGDVFRIKGYGVKGRKIGTLDSLIAEYRAANEKNHQCNQRWASAYGK